MLHRPIAVTWRKLSAAIALLIVLLVSGCASTTGHQRVTGNAPAAPQATRTAPVQSPQPTLAPGIFTRPITYVALGASDAVGVGSDTPGAQGYVPLVAARLPKGSHLLNLGVSGIRLHEALSEELPLAISTSPDLVSIWLVVNDYIGGVTYQDYMRDLDTLLSQLRSHTRARVVMANIPDLTRLPAFANLGAVQRAQMLVGIQQWNKGMAQKAAQYRVILLDLFSHGSELTEHPEYISGDGFHPSPAGYVQLADLFWRAIRQQ